MSFDKERLRRVAKNIPLNEFKMNVWAENTSCGTVGCLAYHICKDAGANFAFLSENNYTCVCFIDGKFNYIDDIAAEILGVTGTDIHDLFDPLSWRYADDFKNADDRGDTEEIKSLLLKEIEAFIAKKEKEENANQ